MVKLKFDSNIAYDKGATFVLNNYAHLKQIVYINNICKNLVNKDTYEPDNLAIMIPISYETFIIQYKITKLE